ncbi:MAG: hypothetical protein HY686_04980 [Chloroflexi bacterium]|nr:hypothetical protein [Chloroflexota bacterium]
MRIRASMMMLLLLVACAPAARQQHTPSPTMAPQPTPAPVVGTSPNATPLVRLTLVAEKAEYKAGEPVRARARVENTSGKPAPYTMWNIGDAPIYLWVELPQGGAQPLYEEGQGPKIVLPAVTGAVLEAGGVLERTVIWDQRLSPQGSPTQAPPGTYIMLAVFNLGDHQQGESTRVEARATVRILAAGP